MTPARAYFLTVNSEIRKPELEAIISKSAYLSFLYAKDNIKERFILAEPIISKDALYSYWYARYIIKGRWELGEAAISKDAIVTYWYALFVIKGRLPDFMHNAMIFSNHICTKNYLEIIK